MSIGFLAYDGVNAFDLVGPMEVFASVHAASGEASPYRIETIGHSLAPVRARSGLVITPSCTMAAAPPLHTIVVPGGPGLRDPVILAQMVRWLAANAASFSRVVSVCTGLFVLAEAGLADGRQVTTHWRFGPEIRRRFPAVRVDEDRIFVKDGPLYTSGGISAGIDLALELVEEDLGHAAALATAREMVVYLKRPGDQRQYSAPLQLQSRGGDRFAALANWMAGALQDNLSNEVLAARMCLTPRHFGRQFKAVFDCTPAAFVERLRVDQAAELLLASDAPVDGLSATVGYASSDTFRRAFERRFGVAPSDYRNRFRGRPSSPGKAAA